MMRKFLFAGGLLVVLAGAYVLASGDTLSARGPLVLLALVVLGAILLPNREWPPLGMLAFPAIVAVLSALAFWQAAPSVSTYPTVTLTVTGEKHPAALAAEVWMAGLGQPSQELSVKGFDGWASRGNAVVGFESTEKTIRVPGRWSEGAVIRFGKGPYSGVVEVATDGQRSRIDLYSPTPDSVDVALPKPVAAPISVPFRALSTFLFAWALFLLCARTAKKPLSFRYCVAYAAILTGILAWLSTAHMSAAGDVELLLVDVGAATEKTGDATAFLGTGAGYAERLPLPIGNYANQAFVVSRDAAALTLRTNIAPLAIWKQEGGGGAVATSLTCSPDRPLVAEFATHRQVSVQGVMSAGTEFVVAAPNLPAGKDGASAAGRRFLVCWPYEDGMLVAWSSAYLKYGAWTGPVGAIERVRINVPGAPAAVLRLSSSSLTFASLHSLWADEFAYPRISSPLSHADQARRFATSLIAGLCVLLLLPLGEVYKLLRMPRDRVQGSAAGCCLAIIVTWALFTIGVTWPGIIGWDAISPFIQHGTGGMALWYGVGYPLYISAMLNLGGPELSLLLKVLLVGVATLWVAVRSLHAGVKGWLVCAYLAGMPLLTGTTMVAATELRDAVNGVALSAFGIYAFALLIRYRSIGSSLPALQYCLLAIFGAMAVLLRTDNVVFVGTLLAGFALGRGWRRTLPACLAIAVLWMGVTPAVVRYVMDSGDGGQGEMRLYKQSAFVNPLVGMLRGDFLTPDERAELSATLNKVLKVDYSIEHWTPSDVVYWHQTEKGQGTPEILAELQKAFFMNAIKHPVEFATLRTITSLKALGMDAASAWLAQKYIDRPFVQPPYFDHLAGKDAHWQSMVVLAGYRPPAHLFPEMTTKVHSWYERIALGGPQVLFALVLLFGFRRFPATALLAAALLLRVAVFWLMQPASVFLYLAELQILGTLLPLLAWTEWRLRSAEGHRAH
ncbi:hypothetical protein [Achromobacter xylosoxidans]|nr:hypothetical protein [Achromobacter xylosoxidans]MBC9906812.1 hypothetical protein [Achromobacter xylosoxidans]